MRSWLWLKLITLGACTVALLRRRLPSTASNGHLPLPAPCRRAHHPGHVLIARLCTPPTRLCIPTHPCTHPFMQVPSHPSTCLSSTPTPAPASYPQPSYTHPVLSIESLPTPPFMSTHTHAQAATRLLDDLACFSACRTLDYLGSFLLRC